MAYARVYTRFKLELANGVHDLDGAGTYKAMLMDPTYVFDSSHDTVADLTAYEIDGTGYASGFSGAGRKTLTTLSLVEDTVNELVVWKFDDLTWSAIDAGTFNAMVIIFVPGGASDDGDCTPVSYHYFGSVVTDGSDETITIDVVAGALQLVS